VGQAGSTIKVHHKHFCRLAAKVAVIRTVVYFTCRYMHINIDRLGIRLANSKHGKFLHQSSHLLSQYPARHNVENSCISLAVVDREPSAYFVE
jgi:hypothetical protein